MQRPMGPLPAQPPFSQPLPPTKYQRQLRRYLRDTRANIIP
ncbi:hypothetical protein MPS_2841 [Mycobacterium pseudoshottsii JCM 15466]|nr:hypothetical protein MPS_2841 [Mycobacterium pseudoshottsii JCM 15466]